MNIKIFDPKTDDNIFLSLEQKGDEVFVVAVDTDGSVRSYLAGFSKEGIYLSKNVHSSIGFPLNSAGQIKIKEFV